jgi:DNA-binding transcriptional LysR family regulator
MAINLPVNMLRSFVAIVDTGSMLSAAEQVYVTQSALSLQIKRLEELTQQPLFVREGRKLTLTPAGKLLLDYARKLLAVHDEAVAAVSGGRFSGPVRIGTVQDFADMMLTGLLARFGQLNPDLELTARVAGTAELQQMLSDGLLDFAVGYAAPGDPAAVRRAETVWFGQAPLIDRSPLPLAVLERPCRFREAMIAALDAVGRGWRIAVETPNLSTLRAAVAAGLGLTSRTNLFLRDLPPIIGSDLPLLPDVSCILLTANGAGEPVQRLAGLATDMIREI